MKALLKFFILFIFSFALTACGGGEDQATADQTTPVAANPPVATPQPSPTPTAPVPSTPTPGTPTTPTPVVTPPVTNPPVVPPVTPAPVTPSPVVNPPVVKPVTPTPVVPVVPTPTPVAPVTPVTPVTPTPVIIPPVITTPVSPTACVAGTGVDYQVGIGKPYTSPEQVPWENIQPGDTVRIFYQPTPYKAKFMLSTQGTADKPVRICGVKGPNGERPIIEGNGAVSRPQLSLHYASTPDYRAIHEDRTLVLIKASALGNYMDTPSFIQIDGLHLRSIYPTYTYTDTAGAVRPQAKFNACIWVDRGHNITIKDNEISDCAMGVFSKSTDEGVFAVSKSLVISGNYLHGHGVVGSETEHSTYTQSHGTLIEGNLYGPLRPGAMGNSIKDRSAGLIVRFNRVEEGAHSVDMVESEDFPLYAMAQPEYRTTYVYGNQFIKTGDTGSFFHYGGDHFSAPAGANWGEAYFRRGTLYFFNNSIIGKGQETRLFQLSTSLEKMEAWNNVFWFEPSVTMMRLVQPENDTLSPMYTGDGVMNFGKNWFKSGWVIMDPYHTTKAQITGTQNFITGATIPFDATTFKPLANSVIIDASQATLPAVSLLPVFKQWTSTGLELRAVNGASMDLGAVEY